MKRWIGIKNSNGYDTFFVPFEDDKTWKPVLEIIESSLDDMFLMNGNKLDGLNLEINIVDDLPSDVVTEE